MKIFRLLTLATLSLHAGANDVSAAENSIYQESFFCGCRINVNAGTTPCQAYPAIKNPVSDFSWFRLLTVGGGACSGQGAPRDCPKEQLSKELNEDLYNWLPVHPDIASILKGRTFLEIGIERQPQNCDLEVSEGHPTVEPPNHLKGDIARRSLYLIARYNVSVSDSYMTMLLHWDEIDPVAEAEYLVSRQIGERQGSDNAFVTIRYQKAEKRKKPIN